VNKLKQAVDNVVKDPSVPATIALALVEIVRQLEALHWADEVDGGVF